MANACILGIIISKLGYKQELSLVILFEVDESPKVGLNNTVQLLCLAISLKIESHEELTFDAEEVTKP